MLRKNKPRGELAIQTIAMPADTNANGEVFGGWLVSQMDLAAAVIAKQRAGGGRVTTVAIDSMVFHKPVSVGNLVCCYAELIKVGTTSMTIKIDVWTIDRQTFVEEKVTEGSFVYVAIDDLGKPREIT